MSQRFEMRLSDEMLARIDAARGDLPRATWMKRALEKALGEHGPPKVVRDASNVPSPPASPRAPAPDRCPSCGGRQLRPGRFQHTQGCPEYHVVR